MAGAYTDDGLPTPPGVPRFAWSQVEGPVPAVWTSSNAPLAHVTFPAAGRYRLRFQVHDGLLATTDEVEVTVSGGTDDYETWLARYFSAAELADPAIGGPDADPDRDGQGNRNEYLSGTHPREAASVLRVRAVRVADGWCA